jgi:UDP-N-acetylglucosamine diphosphorylase / glucose-1-phosphate thymidylyltransferase / UDP-N-acetylgalactosamine diphosphorylase / glucosamine-1-phosphate N-acetyltransferase / galactosamine-1-phosphate N-acetyltransferase
LINIVIPMAGLGSRFSKSGYIKTKPFIDILGKPMIARVLYNLKHPNARYILIVREEHIYKEKLIIDSLIETYGVVIVPVKNTTEGTACTVLHARKYINNDSPLVIANSDQIIDIDIVDFTRDCKNRGLDGSIITFKDPEMNPKWSYAKTDINGNVTLVKEKQPISENATVGIYLFSKGADFVNSAIDMIASNDRVNGEFYTAPAYNYLVDSKKIGIFNIDMSEMHGIGTPDDLDKYISKIT